MLIVTLNFTFISTEVSDLASFPSVRGKEKWFDRLKLNYSTSRFIANVEYIHRVCS